MRKGLMYQRQSTDMVSMGVRYKNGPHILTFQQRQIRQGITLAINPYSGINDDPLSRNFHRQATGSYATGSPNKDDLHNFNLSSSLIDKFVAPIVGRKTCFGK